MTTHKPTTCTAQYADGTLCGKPGVYTFESTNEPGRFFCECAAHQGPPVGKACSARYRVGAEVEIERHGHKYLGIVTKVGARGAVYAEVVYGNGAKRTVRV